MKNQIEKVIQLQNDFRFIISNTQEKLHENNSLLKMIFNSCLFISYQFLRIFSRFQKVVLETIKADTKLFKKKGDEAKDDAINYISLLVKNVDKNHTEFIKIMQEKS